MHSISRQAVDGKVGIMLAFQVLSSIYNGNKPSSYLFSLTYLLFHIFENKSTFYINLSVFFVLVTCHYNIEDAS